MAIKGKIRDQKIQLKLMDRPIENETHFPLMFANLNFTVMVMTTQVERETNSALEF